MHTFFFFSIFLPLWNYSNKWGISDKTKKQEKVQWFLLDINLEKMTFKMAFSPLLFFFFLFTLVKFDDTWLVHYTWKWTFKLIPYSRLQQRKIKIFIHYPNINNVENKNKLRNVMKKKHRVNIGHLVETTFFPCYMHVCYRLD